MLDSSELVPENVELADDSHSLSAVPQIFLDIAVVNSSIASILEDKATQNVDQCTFSGSIVAHHS